MAHRVGVCQSCRARFQIPASFSPRRAKCRNCGGVVEIGPPEGAPEPVPQRAATATVAPRAAEPAPVPAPTRAPAPAAPMQPAVPPERAAPPRRSGFVRALLFAGIAALLAAFLWGLLR